MPHHDPLEFSDESTAVDRLRREAEWQRQIGVSLDSGGRGLLAADILVVCSSIAELEAENKRLLRTIADLRVLIIEMVEGKEA